MCLPCAGKIRLAEKFLDKVNSLAILDRDVLREWLASRDFSRKGITLTQQKSY